MHLTPTTNLIQTPFSLAVMPPTTRSQAHRLDTTVAPATEYHDHSDTESELDDLDADNIVRSPFTGLMYDISQLPTGDSAQGAVDSQQTHSRVDPGDQDRDIQGRVRELFRKLGSHESPPINLQFCGLGEEDGGEFYAFQLREIIPLSIRIGTPTSRWSEPHCSCRNRKPCQHLIWLYDAISGLSLDNHDDSRPLVVNRAGGIPGMEDPFSTIADFRLDLLTKGLHCGVGSSYEYGNRDWFREMEADEILLALEGSGSEDDSDLDHHHSYPNPSKRRRLEAPPQRRSRLERTVRELLVQNNEVFSVFLNMLSPRDKVRNLYSRLQDRVDAVLLELKRYSESLADPSLASDLASTGADREGRCDVAWASRHILRAVSQIGSELLRAPGPGPRERADAARALMHILEAVVLGYDGDMYPSGASPRDRNLYRRLVEAGGHAGGLFVVEQLGHVLDQTQHADRIEAIKKRVRARGAPAAYLDRLEEVAAGMRSIQSRQGSAVPYSPSVSSSADDGGESAGGLQPVVADSAAPSVQATAGLKRTWEGDY
ncbi:hypothetical protein, variant [Gaeumannomyces tritici R3-111a-1]|uniref:SWIM-type domain-containing protein n=1 Tax=Gaeumannomyces tritici (strain R3-111a-1) TaxID=644352 RepID=J3P7Y2_GAET3|nr:hypothetical protein GGTG_09622 [Gaeumannomyces tritici R3-111a-1]XP_009225740.1 hypothetical protein, variant [Gaeumannomyces tritici R3-111a-1]EJT72765.1 hypothetical protein, variant [Gaeumannomyces tritici R3-111a-1]EJT72766.1 hypothetical protein GGTG_09622 [Gaeumannomyces tritici R3-111a-1]